MNVSKRIKLAKRHKTLTNCFGAALYITGIVRRNRFIAHLGRYEKRLKRLEELMQPEVYALIIFRRGDSQYADHTAIVTGLNPTLLSYRDFRTGLFIEKEPLKKFLEWYNTEQIRKNHGPITKVEYRKIPNPL